MQVADAKIKLLDALLASAGTAKMSVTDCEESMTDVVKMDKDGLLRGLPDGNLFSLPRLPDCFLPSPFLICLLLHYLAATAALCWLRLLHFLPATAAFPGCHCCISWLPLLHFSGCDCCTFLDATAAFFWMRLLHFAGCYYCIFQAATASFSDR